MLKVLGKPPPLIKPRFREGIAAGAKGPVFLVVVVVVTVVWFPPLGPNDWVVEEVLSVLLVTKVV